MDLSRLTEHFASPAWLAVAAGIIVMALAVTLLRADGGTGARIVTGIRALALALICIALAGPMTARFNPHAQVIFAVDVSSSIAPGALVQARELINEVLASKPPRQRVGVVAFGNEPVQQRALHGQADTLHELGADVDPGASNLERALAFAASRFDSPRNRRIVLMSDARQTHGSALDAANAIASNAVHITAIPLASDEADTFELYDLRAPDNVATRAAFRITAHYWSRAASTTTFRLFRNGTPIEQVQREHGAGRGAVTFTDQLLDEGIFEYEVVAANAIDEVPQNNTARAFTAVRGQPRVALVAPPGHDVSALMRAFAAQGLEVATMAPAALPGDVHALSRYALVVLANISAFDLATERMSALESYVRDVGGGVLVAGGERAYSAGGYQQTPLENLLPVVMEIPAEVNIPSLVVAILLDRSGSMSGTSGGEEKLSIAKSAAFAAVEVLGPLDRVGVLAFDSDVEWVVPVTEASRRLAIAGRLATLSAGGGTNLEAALEAAASRLEALPAKLKHLIVLSDGLSDTAADEDGVYDDLAARLNDGGITISTVAFGADANQPLMARLAAGGNGRFYHTDDPRNVPRIFTSETVVISRGLIVEKVTQPQLGAATELLAVLSAQPIPALDGYMRVHPKPSAEVLLGTPDGDPLLAVWQFGLGRVSAFTTDLAPRWSSRWLNWSELPSVLSGVARWTMRAQSDLEARASYAWEPGRGTLRVDAASANGEFANGLALQARITPARGTAVSRALEQVGPGLYQGEFNSVPGMRYTFSVSRTREDGSEAPVHTFAATAPVARERTALGADRKLLERISAATGGRVVELEAVTASDLLASTGEGDASGERIGWPWIAAALAMLLLDVALRRVLLARTRNVQTVPREQSGA